MNVCRQRTSGSNKVSLSVILSSSRMSIHLKVYKVAHTQNSIALYSVSPVDKRTQ